MLKARQALRVWVQIGLGRLVGWLVGVLVVGWWFGRFFFFFSEFENKK